MAYNRKLLYTKSFPSWNTPEGNLGSIGGDVLMTPIQLVATEINEPGSTITYAVTTGALPIGLTLSSSGEISGTPTGYTVNETVNFTITATDDEGETASRDFSLQVILEYEIDYLVVAGGGAGGMTESNYGGAGGAGGLITSYGSISGGGSVAQPSLTANFNTNYSIIVGSGGNGQDGDDRGNNGSNSVFSSITALGGGGGGTQLSHGITDGKSGGSGGGGGYGEPNSNGGNGAANQGYSGGDGFSGPNSSGGGGGAGGVGGTQLSNNGGVGLAVNILNSTNALSASVGEIVSSNVYYAGGGGGTSQLGDPVAVGGLGGGGNGATFNSSSSTTGDVNTGGGGGGGTNEAAGRSGGSGVVILRMPTANYSGSTTGSPLVFTEGSDTVLVYKGSGTYTG